ncbi:MAG: hypothetical protein KAT43_06225 [Nanoarchaeota archaeon]|nr:hypothetical protein [Nanoarchaeota archaeon]
MDRINIVDINKVRNLLRQVESSKRRLESLLKRHAGNTVLLAETREIDEELHYLINSYRRLKKFVQSEEDFVCGDLYHLVVTVGKEVVNLIAYIQKLLEKSREVEQMAGEKPKYKGDGIAAWENTDKNGNKYLTVKILGAIRVNMFPIESDELE